MKKTFTVTIKNKETGKVSQEQVNSDEYILEEFEKKGFKLAFSCRNGCCTSCAVKIISGTLQQPEAMGVSQALKDKGMHFFVLLKQLQILRLKLHMKMKYTIYNLDSILEEEIQELLHLGNLRKINYHV